MENRLDAHCEAIIQEYRSAKPQIEAAADEVSKRLRQAFAEVGFLPAALEYRVKTEESLRGKLELKGNKYRSLADITDILGLRVITFYSDDVDKVASMVERLFEVDWANSVDKRKLHEVDSFGYLSLHYICSMEGFGYRFEVQMRTILQHAWANLNHDTGYKSGVEVPREYLRNLNRLAGMLELADEQFSRIHSELADYRRRVQGLVASGNLDEVALDGETYRSYLELRPFDKLNRRIAAVNQAEVQQVSLMPYLPIFSEMGCRTLGDIERMIKEYGEGAYQIACYQIGLTDLDIISSSLAPQNLCIAGILMGGGGRAGLKRMFDMLNGPSEGNGVLVEMLMEQVPNLPFMNMEHK
ncbi:MAG: hypothetical protein IJU19_01580 [Bacteroidales bacterium]|nr:hypothetical protein [Bacteroidales bacterium]